MLDRRPARVKRRARSRAVAPRSDLDLAIDAGTRLRPAALPCLQFRCEDLRTLHRIDLVDLQATDAALREEIHATGVAL